MAFWGEKQRVKGANGGLGAKTGILGGKKTTILQGNYTFFCKDKVIWAGQIASFWEKTTILEKT